MKINPDEVKLNINLGSSKFSAGGFIDDDFSLERLVLTDKRKMNELGIDEFVLSRGLNKIYTLAQCVFGAKVDIKPGYHAVFFESRGMIPSPFIGHGVFEKGEVSVFSKNMEKDVIITKLGIAMIRDYSFFQGTNSRYRIDPEIALKFIDI